MKRQGFTEGQRIDNPVNQSKQFMQKRLLTVKEASAYLGMSLPTFRSLYWNGKLPIIKGNEKEKIRVDIKDLDKWIDQNKTTYTY